MIDTTQLNPANILNPEPAQLPGATTGATPPSGGMGMPMPTTPQANYGGSVSMPWQWGQAGQTLGGMAQTGMPTPYSPWYQQAKQVAGQDIAREIGQASETAGLKGMRWSTPLARQAQEIAGRRMGEVGLEWTGRELDALEQARQRQLQATGQLMPLGQMAGMFPLDVAQRYMGMGGEMQRQRQAEIAPLYQEFMRGTPEASPWLNLLMGATSMPFQQTPQMYQPSFMSQLLGMGSSALPFI